jgi:hypothetical protein
MDENQKTRKLIDGRTVHELEESFVLTVKTKCPSKYMIVDLETGTQYVGTNDPKLNWKKILTFK